MSTWHSPPAVNVVIPKRTGSINLGEPFGKLRYGLGARWLKRFLRY